MCAAKAAHILIKSITLSKRELYSGYFFLNSDFWLLTSDIPQGYQGRSPCLVGLLNFHFYVVLSILLYIHRYSAGQIAF